MRTIFLFEWKRLYRNPVSVILLLFFLSSGLYSIFFGARIIQIQSDTIDSLQTAYNIKIKSSIEIFKTDTSTRQGKIEYQNVSSPASVNYLIKPPAIFFPNAFSVLAIGQRNVLPFYKEISSEKSFTQAYEPDISNPEVLIQGSFDLSFVIIYLLPLLMIVLSYNVVSQEKDDGTFLLLHSQSSNANHILFYKLLFRLLIVGLFTLLLNIIAIYRSLLTFPITITEFICWFLIINSYLLFWCSVCYVVILFNKSSAVNVFYLSGCWLLLSIVLPFLLNFYVNMSRPLGIRADIVSVQREIEEDIWAIKPKELIRNFYVLHPEYRTGNLSDTLEYSSRRFAAYYDELERRISPIAKVYNEQINERNTLINSLSDFVPTLKTQKMLNQIGVSDLKSFSQFDRSTMIFQQRWQAFIYWFIFNDQDLQEKDYQNFPVYTSPGNSFKYLELIIGALQLCLPALFLMAIRYYNLNKLKT